MAEGGGMQQSLTRTHVEDAGPLDWPDGSRAAFCLRVDVDTSNCLIKGVPALLRALKEHDIRATFFVPMGPDRLGRNFNPACLREYLRLVPLRKFGAKNLLYGLLLPPPDMGNLLSTQLAYFSEDGHEFALHGYDHARWAQSLRGYSDEEVRRLFLRGRSQYESVFGESPEGFASPEFQWTSASLDMLDEFGFLYGGDFRGSRPFWPRLNSRSLKTLQIPVTLPNLEELSRSGMSDKQALKAVCLSLEEKIRSGGLAVLLVHPSYEGLYKRDMLLALLDFISDRRDKLWLATMRGVAKWWMSKFPSPAS